MSIATGHTCPHCEEHELVIDFEGGNDVPNGPTAMYAPDGYVVRCAGAISGECNSPDMTGRCQTKEDALNITIESLSDWMPHCINAANKSVEVPNGR